MKLVRATEKDSEKLNHYFKNIVLPGKVDFSFSRVGSFFNQYRLQSNDFATYILLNDQDLPEAMASLIFRQARIEGQLETICFATDLRVSPSRGAILSWSQHFLPILEREKATRQCRYVFSVVPENHKQAYNAFIGPRSLKRKLPRYFLFRRFHAVSLHGLWPFHPQPLSSIKIALLQSKDQDALREYLMKKKMIKPLCFSATTEEMNGEIDQWADLSWEKFVVAKDNKGNLLGCAGIWSSDHIQKISPVSYSPPALTLKEGLHILSYLGKAKRLPPLHQEFQFSYLTHLFAENPDIFYSLLFYCYHAVPRHEFITYSHFDNYWLTTPPRGFLASTLSSGFYCLLSPDQTVPDFLKPNHLHEPPDFELALW